MTNGNGQGQATGKEPVERVKDLFVHMPIGFAVMAWKRVPALVVSVPELVGQAMAKGCAQIAGAEERLSEEVRKARMIGQVAVTFGGRQVRREVDARLADARRKAEGVANFIPGVGADGPSNGATGPAPAAKAPAKVPAGAPAPAKAAPAKTASTKAPAAKAASTKAAGTKARATRSPATKPSAARGSAPKAATTKAATTKVATTKAATSKAATTKAPAGSASAADLSIREYDGLSASQVVSRLTGLTPDELRAVRAYEDASRGRRTVLLAIDRLLDE